MFPTCVFFQDLSFVGTSWACVPSQTLRIRWSAAQIAQSQEEARRLVESPRLAVVISCGVLTREGGG